MRIHILSRLFRDPVKAELESARSAFAEAYRENRAATDRQDTRRMRASAIALRAANTRLLRAEMAFDEARA